MWATSHSYLESPDMQKMDPMDVMREYLAAKEEHERALAALSSAQQQLEVARSEFADARQVELQMEQDLQRATTKVAAGLQEMHLGESDTGADAASPTVVGATTEAVGAADAVEEELASVLPVAADSLVEYHRNIGCYHCYVFVNGDGGYDQLDATQFEIQVAFPVVKLRMKPAGACADDRLERAGGGDAERGELWWSTEIERNVDQAKCVIDVKVSERLGLTCPCKRCVLLTMHCSGSHIGRPHLRAAASEGGR